MITFRLTTDIPDDHRVVLTLPQFVPTGQAELEVNIRAPSESNGDLERRFEALVQEWKATRGYSSSLTRMSMHYAYQQIIGLGKPAIPLLFGELARQPDHWFWALKVLTGVNPVPPEDRGNVKLMAAHWLRWGAEQGYRW